MELHTSRQRAEPPGASSVGVTPAFGLGEVWERAEGGLSFELTAQRCGTGVNFEMMSETPNTFPKLAEEQRKLGWCKPTTASYKFALY